MSYFKATREQFWIFNHSPLLYKINNNQTKLRRLGIANQIVDDLNLDLIKIRQRLNDDLDSNNAIGFGLMSYFNSTNI